MLPVHYRHTGDVGFPNPDSAGNATTNSTAQTFYKSANTMPILEVLSKDSDEKPKEIPPSNAMLWLYVMFVYLFTALALYLIVRFTKNIIRVRQAFLGGQSTVTDKTIKLSGIPVELRSEDAIKETIENLQIGKVDSILLCRDWYELDEVMQKRSHILRQLEGAWTAYLGHHKAQKRHAMTSATRSEGQTRESGENEALIDGDAHETPHVEESVGPRPTTRLWYGFLNLQSHKVDALDYYAERLRKLDEEIAAARKKMFKPMPLAFVTMDSTASAVCLFPCCSTNRLC